VVTAADPARGMNVGIVIPAFQAERTIGDVLRAIPDWVKAIVVVDDASPDGTSAAARSVADPRVTILRSDRNRGVGAAMATGYREALRLGSDIVVKMDADGQMDAAQLPRLLEPILSGRADHAKGNRFSTSAHLHGMPSVRLFGNAGLSFLVKACSGNWHVFDPTNGYTATHRRALAAIDLSRVHARYFFETSMLVLLSVARAVVEDVPMPARYRGEASHLSVRRTVLEFPPLLVRYGAWRFLKTYLVHDFNATSLLVVLGLPSFLFGVLDGLSVWIHSVVTGRFAATGTVIIPTLAIVLGFQMLLHALMLDVQNVPRRPLQAGPGPG
jgi:dolichol-phosphate mannosyltransferase